MLNITALLSVSTRIVSLLFRHSYLNCYFRLLKNGFIIQYPNIYIKC